MPGNTSVFNYMPHLRRDSPENFATVLQTLRDQRGMLLYAIKADPRCLSPSSSSSSPNPDSHTEVLGLIAFLDIQPQNRALEIGLVLYSPVLQRTAGGTEAQYFLLRYAFGEADSKNAKTTTPILSPPYRRVVWKCNALNTTSRRAAERLGFVYEGTLRSHLIYAGRSRDSEFFSILEEEWAGFVRAGFEMWLDKGNFGEGGRQVKNLEECRETCRGA